MLSKLLRMGVGEVAERSRQEASKWLERNALFAARSQKRARQLAQAGHDFAAQQTLDHFQSTSPSRFFAGVADQETASLCRALDPGAVARIVSSAEAHRQGRFDLLGYRDLSFGDPVDWHLDPISDRRSALKHWTKVDPLDVEQVGDTKVVWELSRQQFLVTLGLAYRATDDETHADTFVGFFRAWNRANPAGWGINWTSSLEAALRIVSWSWALSLFRLSPRLTRAFSLEVIEAIETHAAHVERYLSCHSSPNTHLTGEALGLFYAGTLFPSHPLASRWRARGKQILDAQIHAQVLSDGVYFEQATAYQIYTVEIYLHYLILAARTGLPVDPAVPVAMQKMLDVLLALRRPDGGIPLIGDQDGGSLLPLIRREPSDARGLFAVAAAFFGRADFAWAAGALQPEALWLLGPSAVGATESVGAAPPREASRAFVQGGYVVMRSSWRRTAHHLVFDAGPLGCRYSSGHGHADLLSVIVSSFGEPFIVDPGTCVYAANPGLRDHFRGTAAHSTITVDGRSQAEPKGPFGWREGKAATLRRFEFTREFDLADASHDAYARITEPIRHRRRVLFVKSPGYFVIVDDLTGAADGRQAQSHLVEQRFQFAPMKVSVTTDSWVRAQGSRGRGLLVRSFGANAIDARIESGSEEPLAGWVSPNYGQRVAAPLLTFAVRASLPIRIVTLLLPVEDSHAKPPRVSPVHGAGDLPVGLAFEDKNETVRFDEDTVSFERGLHG